METGKASTQYRYDKFNVTIAPINETKLQITVVDPIDRMEFSDKQLVLTNISTATLMRALENKMIQIKLTMKVNRTPENAILEMNILVASQFFKAVEEQIFIKKTRDVSESEVLRNAVSTLSSKFKQVKENDNLNPNIIRYAVREQQKLYNTMNSNFDLIASVRLPKGKYLFTLSFLVNTTNSVMYLYLQKSQQVFPNARTHLPTRSQYVPIILRKTFVVVNDSDQVAFYSYYGQSFPVKIRNAVLTAQLID